MTEKRISGQLIFRETSSADKILPGQNKKMMMVFGILAVPNDTDLESEHQYAISGIDAAGVTKLDVHMRSKVDRSETTIGNTPGGILCQPIWKV